MNKLLQEITARADASQVEGLSRFFKTGPGQYGEGDKFLGIKVPVTREVVKACWRETSKQDLGACIASEYHEVRLAALLALVEIFAYAKRFPVKPGISQQDCVDFYLAHTDRINNWDLVDLSCYPLLGVWLLDKDRQLLYDLARNGKTIWEQRIGIVSTMTFIRHGQLQDTFDIADILPASPARPHSQSRRLAAPRGRKTRQGSARRIPGTTLSNHAPDDAPVCHREVPGSGKNRVFTTIIIRF